MNYLFERIRELAIQIPTKNAVVFKRDSLTYEQLYEKALSIAMRLIEKDVKAGDRVCLSAVSKPEVAAAYLGILMCGAVAVFIDKAATSLHMCEIYNETKAKVLLTDKPIDDASVNVQSLQEAYINQGNPHIPPYTPSEDNISEILFTTGSTGKPKGVMLSYKAVNNILMNTIKGCGYYSETIMLLPLPLNHSFALRVLRAVLYVGGTVVLQNGFTFAKEVENNILSFGCNSITCVPASYEVIKGQMQDAFQPIMSKLRSFEAGAGSLSISQRRELVTTLPNTKIINVWGSSETGGAIFCHVNEVVKSELVIGSLGRVIDGAEIIFLSEETPFDRPDELKRHLLDWSIHTDAAHPGRMAIRGDMIMSGYWNDTRKTEETIIDGWLITGDMAYQDEEGNIFMLGRADDLINVGGEKVSPIEIENMVSQYKHIRDCACVGAEDDLMGQIPVLFIVTGLGYEKQEFHKWMASRIERAKLPQKIVALDEIPRNRMKKIDRKELKKLLENQNSLLLMNSVIEAIISRRSIRKFTDQEVSKDILSF